jgi:phage shock protein PspC (stress-responsive transcriptional regulator)
MVAGVAGGLAEYFRIDPVLIRIGFAITGLMGFGLLAYLAFYVFVPADDGWGNPVHARDRDRWLAGGAIVLLLIAIPGGAFPLTSNGWLWGVGAFLFWIAVLAGIGYALFWLVSGSRRGDQASYPGAVPAVDPETGETLDQEAATAVMPGRQAGPQGDRSFGRVLLMTMLFATLAVFSLGLAFTSAWGAAVGGAGFIAVVVILCGALIALAAFKRPMRWLIIPAVAIALPAAAVQASGYEIEGGYGDRLIRPALLADIPSDGYTMAAGNMTIDLRRADWQPDSRVHLKADLNFGEMTILVPRNVCVASDIEITAGAYDVFEGIDEGIGIDYRRSLPADATPQLIVDAKVDLGVVEVLRELPPDGLDFHDRPRYRDPEDTQPAHCLGTSKKDSAQDESAPQKGPKETQPRRAPKQDESAPQKGPKETQLRRAPKENARAEG